LRTLYNQVGSYNPRRENFRLTPEVKAKFTENLGSDPKEFSGRKVLSCPEPSPWCAFIPKRAANRILRN
jgi:hypothetical protein